MSLQREDICLKWVGGGSQDESPVGDSQMQFSTLWFSLVVLNSLHALVLFVFLSPTWD